MRGISPWFRRLPGVRLGLRLQIVLALVGLMLFSFVPLYFAVASLTRVTIADARGRAALAVARMMATRLAEPSADGGPAASAHAMRVDVEASGVDAACFFGTDGRRLACAGSDEGVRSIRPPPAEKSESVLLSHGAAGRAMEVVAPGHAGTVVARVRLDDLSDRATPLLRLVAMYMTSFGLALLVFAYLVLTRLIVRPVDQLVQAADRVASGARTLRVPRSGARELIELGASVQTMAEKLISEEAALIVKVDELTHATTRLTDTRAQLIRSERMASVGRLAAGVAHEIGNPLAAIMGMQELLLDGQLAPEAHRDFLERMRRETERIHTVVRDMLDFARPHDTPSSPGAPAPAADIGSVVEDVAALVRPQKPFRTIVLETDVPTSLRAAISAPRLTQILLNIVLNAGAAVASARRDGGRVRISARASEGRARIEVEDDGPGIPESVRDRLFEPFVTTKDIGEGTGLGLAVCRGLVESAGGDVGVDPSYRAGARFYVVLPLERTS